MSRRCSICASPQAGAMNERIRSGATLASVAVEFSVSDDALARHARRHLVDRPSTIPAIGHDPLDELVSALRARALAGDPAVVREYRLALAAQSDVRHATPPTRDLASEPEWLELRARMLHALEPHPEARLAVVAALEDA